MFTFVRTFQSMQDLFTELECISKVTSRMIENYFENIYFELIFG
jgi:hypothetical protein